MAQKPIFINEESSPPPSKGGGGGTVFLIVGVLFIGYLYVSRRLDAVVKAIQTPPGIPGLPGGGPPLQPAQIPSSQYGTVPIVNLAFPSQYNAAPITVPANQLSVYEGTYARTGSPTLAAIYARYFPSG